MIIALQTLLFFRESIITVIERFLRPYYKKLSLKFEGNEDSDDEESDDHVYAEYNDEKGVVFYPPVYAQRYAAVSDCLMDERWYGKLEKVVDFGYHDMSFIKYLKDVPGIKHILGVDIETIPLRCSSDLLGCNNYVAKKENPLHVTLFQGNAADPDYRLVGCDAVVAIEIIEHMLPHDLERLIHTVFGFIKPWVAIFTTPNGDFNVLFKALEKNGLRRMDHMFEWSREQFHDWCSNIVARYPGYTVMCKGIGPGPQDTLHLGCCSQLALFVAKEYNKQPDLDLNSLALVAKTSSPNDLSHIVGSWESADSTLENNMLCDPPSVEFYPELMYNEPSCMSMVLASPSISLESMVCKDKSMQCNLDSELGKNFLMFEDEVHFNVMLPRREKYNRVYEIEDVASRLNCSTFQVKKFSKATQSLMAKNKMDSFPHTREVVSEIRYLMKMLNFNEDRERDHEGTWCNINWGANAPYWNQYYRIVREYTYPFEFKTDEDRVLDLIIEEINRHIDLEYDDEFTSDMHKLEIPIGQLMSVVEHITTDVDKVRELLEWNGYEVVGDVVIHSRLAIDNISEPSQDGDSQEDTVSDWDATEVHSTSFSDGSTNVPDYYGLCLRRAIDQKVRKLRKLLIADKEITTELDRVVCRLMKLALHASKGRQSPPPISWMQCKLLDLLTLTEKAFERRRLLRYSLLAIEYHKEICLDEIKQNAISEKIVSQYQNLDKPDDELHDVKGDLVFCDDFEFEDYTSVCSNECNDFENNTQKIVTNDSLMVDLEKLNIVHNAEQEKVELGNCSLELVPYTNCTSNVISSGESSCSTSNGAGKKLKKLEGHNDFSFHKRSETIDSLTNYTRNTAITKKLSKSIVDSRHNKVHKASGKKIIKKTSNRRSSFLNILQYESFEYKKYQAVDRINPKEHQLFQSTVSRPIPGSLIKLSYSQLNKNLEGYSTVLNSHVNDLCQPKSMDIAATEECMFIGIITEDGEETIAMRRHIGISPDLDVDIENEDLLESVINLSKDNSFHFKPNIENSNIQSQTIFLYDSEEPSTSKGVRHLSTDAQCGPDVNVSRSMLSQTTSFTKTPNLFTAGLKIKEPNTVVKPNIMTSDFGTCTEMCGSTMTLGRKTVGIKIKESIQNVTEYLTVAQVEEKTFSESSELSKLDPRPETKLLKPVSNTLKIEDSISDFCMSVRSCAESPTRFTISSKNTSDFQIQSESNEKNVVIKISQASCGRRKLVCGGIHVHSFNDRNVSEDVVYQGKWQRKQHSLRCNRSFIGRKSLLLPKKQKIHLKEYSKVNEIQKSCKKVTSLIGPKFNNKNKEALNSLNKSVQNKKLNFKKPIKTSNNVIKKVASKVAVSSHIVSKNTKTIYTKRTSINTIEKTNTNKEKTLKNKNVKHYLPLYLRKKIQSCNVKENNNVSGSKMNVNFENIIHKEILSHMSLSSTEITKDLIKLPENTLITNIDYMILRNEIKKENDSDIDVSVTLENIRDGDLNCSHSPQSQHSSTCSSPNSVATVRSISTRNRVTTNRRNSTSSERSSSGIMETDNKISKGKKFSKRSKINKKPPMLCDNKENFPESSKNTGKIEEKSPIKGKMPRSVFLGRTNSVFTAQITNETSTLPLNSTNISKTKMSICKSLKLVNISSRNEDQKIKLPSSSILDLTLDNSSKDKETKNESSTTISDENVFLNESLFDVSLNNSFESDSCSFLDEADDKSLSSQTIHNTKSKIITAIRKLIEDKLNLPENTYDRNDSDSETVILSRDDNYVASHSSRNIDTAESRHKITLSSEKNVDSSQVCSRSNLDPVKENNTEPNASDLKPPDSESDGLSLKSFASISTSKLSEYYLADNELDITLPQTDKMNINSIQDLFERKEINPVTNVGGVLAIQAFSGFSVNEPIAGNQPDFVNFIDSETGSFAFDSARQATSEEIFVSGRSSDTYESCYVDEEAYVPNWLFNIISQQQSAEESEVEETNMPLPMVEPDYDMNGNVIEPGIGVGAGAGDGRGMHSDHSQDSSGRGTSLSSSEISSGPQSEMTLSNRSNFTTQLDNLRAPMNISAVNGAPSRPDSFPVQNDGENNREEASSHQSRNLRVSMNRAQISSDMDADVSSLETDAIDSDN